MKTPLSKYTVDELVDRFAEICLEQEKAQDRDDHARYNVLYGRVLEVDRELRSRGLAARRALGRLFQHPSHQVRFLAAAKALAVAPGEARETLELLSRSHWHPQAASAGMLLDSLDAGRFRPD